MNKFSLAIAAGAVAFAGVSTSFGQALAYGVSANGELFYFETNTPAVTTTVGTLPFVPEAIDFRPGTKALYGIDVGPVTTQLYQINPVTAAVTPVGAGFPTAVSGSYALAGGIGFDFNPRTLQTDGSIRIRLVSSNTGANLRLNSDTGLVANVDAVTLYNTSGNSTFLDAAAYINSATSTLASLALPTTLYTMDSRDDVLNTQVPPNNGTQNIVGAFGVTVDADLGIAFDILSTNPLDNTIADELAFAAFTRGGGGYLLYSVDLATGQTTNGAIVGSGRDFSGGLALTTIPEPSIMGLVGAPVGLLLARRNRKA